MNRVAVTDHEEARAFLERLELPVAPPSGALERGGEGEDLPKYKADENQAVVVGSQIAEFAADVPAELRPAITNSFLLAQLAANKQIGKDKSGTKAWYDKYNEVLANVGWLVESKADSEKEIVGQGLEVHKEILSVIAVVLGPAVAAAAVVTAALTGLSNMNKDSKWITLFDRQSQRADANQFQVSYARAPGGKAARISISCFELDAKRSIIQVLFFKFSQSEARFRYFTTELSMNRDVFDKVKGVVESKIAGYVGGYVTSLDI